MTSDRGDESANGIVKELLLLAKDDEDTKQAAKNVAATAKVITGTLKRVVYPLAALNYGIDSFAKYMSEKFQDEMTEKTMKIPSADVVDPKPSVAGPIVQALTYTHSEQNLKEMYLNLLASAMNAQTAEGAHPSYVEIIQQLSSDEAALLKIFLDKDTSPIVELRMSVNAKHDYVTLKRNIVRLDDAVTQKPAEIKMMPMYIDNWIRLGLVNVSYEGFMSDEDAYNWVEQRPEYKNSEPAAAPETEFQSKLLVIKGIMTRTKYGEVFSKVVGISS